MPSSLSGPKMLLGVGTQAQDTELRVQDVTFAEFIEKLRVPKIGQKNGWYVLRGGKMKENRRADENLLEAELLVIDGDSRFDPETGEIISGAPDFDLASDTLRKLGVAFVMHTTHSNGPGKPKWRAYIPAHMTSPEQLEPCVTALVEKMNALGCYVTQTKECSTWSQAWFTPRVPSEEAMRWFRHDFVDNGVAFDVAAAVAGHAARQAAEEAVSRAKAAPAAPKPEQGDSTIKQFNRASSLAWVRETLESQGYKFAYKRGDTYRYISPTSETGTPGVIVFKGSEGDWCCYSHHGAHDPLSGKLTDPFGLFAMFQHGGDVKRASRELWEAAGGKSRSAGADHFAGYEADADPFEKARTQDGKAQATAGQAMITANAFVLPDESAIPPRQWLYGYHLIRRFVSATIAPGGVGKSSLVMTEAMAMATGKPLLGVPVEKPLRVWVWCLEDPREELDRRAVAIAKKYGITRADIADRLFLNSGRDTPLCIAEQERRTGTIIVGPHIEALRSEISRLQIDVISIDPFVSSHQVSENDNVSINTVMRQWVALAEQCNIAVELVHHTRKNGDGEVTAETSRGAKALIDATRDTRVLNQMSESEGERFRVENRRLFFRVYSDKMNLAPPADRSDWYQLESVKLDNGVDGKPGDRVGVPVRWEIPGPWHGIPVEVINTILTAIDMGVTGDGGEPTGEPYSDSKRGRSNSRWIGTLIMDATGMDEEAAKRAVKSWIDSGLLVPVKVEIRRKEVNGVQVNKQIWREMVSSNG